MDFSLTSEQQQLREAARRFAAAELPALALELEEKHAPLPHAMMKRYAEMGFLGINLPKEHGGHGLSHLDAVLVLEELELRLKAGFKPELPVPFLGTTGRDRPSSV